MQPRFVKLRAAMLQALDHSGHFRFSPKSGSTADIAVVRFVPCVDAPGWQELSSRLQHWSVQPCVRPFDAAHMTAGHNALRGSGPTKSSHSRMPWHKWVVLIARSTGSGLRAVRSSQLSHHAGCPARSRLPRKRDWLLVSLAPGHHGPDHSRDLVGEPMAATLVGRRASKAVSQGRYLVPWILA